MSVGRIFEKVLSRTDMDNRLSIPESPRETLLVDAADRLSIPESPRETLFVDSAEGGLVLKLRTRRSEQRPKPVITGGWTTLVKKRTKPVITGKGWKKRTKPVITGKGWKKRTKPVITGKGWTTLVKKRKLAELFSRSSLALSRRRNPFLSSPLQQSMPTGFANLPEKDVAEIMSWLPPETLVQSKCVQKSWHSLIHTFINSQWFVLKHLENYGSTSSFLFVSGNVKLHPKHMYCHNYITNNLLVTSDNASVENDQIHVNIEELSSTTTPQHARADYSSHCNGILFYTEKDTNKITLCNPATREFKHLDPNNSCFFGSDYKILMAGFGYDAVANVYKVIRVVCQPGDGGHASSFGAEVCTLGTSQGDSSWRKIKMIEIGNYVQTYVCNGVYHRGTYYWLLNNIDSDSTEYIKIISFDMHEEALQTVPLPAEVDHHGFKAVRSSVLAPHGRHIVFEETRTAFWFGLRGDCVTLLKNFMVNSPVRTDVRPWEMWTMETSFCRHEKISSWVKLPAFLPMEKWVHPVVFWKSDELLLRTSLHGEMVSYNFRAKKIRSVQLHPHKGFYHFSAIVYVKSLVSISGWCG